PKFLVFLSTAIHAYQLLFFLSHETPLYLDELLHFALLHLVLLPSVVRFFLVESLFFIFWKLFLE
ncbi:hypothetical protein, partial [Streptococcus pneumoniae]|uniref:hypothetical protein n=1 Tax=Streptococcus pneumoniae TaxID=1313 RepID=UPI0019530721